MVSLSRFTSKLLKKIENLEEKHTLLESKLNNQASQGENNKSPELRPSLYSTALTNSLIPKYSPPKLQDFEDRLEQIEQDSLVDCIKLDGEVCKAIIEKSKKEREGGKTTTKGSTKKTENENASADLKSEVSKIIQKHVENISCEVISSVSVRGNKNKHLKVKVTSKEDKIEILKTFKRKKPANIYVNDYLTKNRSQLLFKLKTLKKENENKISSVYVYAGNICVKIVNNPKYFIRNNFNSVNSFCKDNSIDQIIADNAASS